MKKRNKVTLILIFFSFLLNSSKASEKIVISSFSLERLKNYQKGKFFSNEENIAISNSSGLYFYLSKNGKYSIIAFCPDFNEDQCSKNHIKFKSKYRCEKISKNDCKLIFNGNKYFFNNININKILKNIDIYFLVQQSPKNIIKKKYSSEIRATTYNEISDDEKYF